MKLTTANIRTLTLPAGKREAIFFDADIPGFGLRLREGGSRSFVFQYRVGTKQRRIVLGKVSASDIGKVRDTAKDLHAKVRLGGDPAGDRAENRAKATETFEAVAATYLTHQRINLRPRSYVDIERHLLKHAKALHGLQLAKIERRDIAACITAVAKNSGPVTGNRVRTSLSGFFSWAIRAGLVDANPVSNTNRHEEKSRDRVLSPAELRLIWNALRVDHYGAILKLLALTAQRPGEIAGLRWSEIDLEKSIIVLPGERTKNHRTHVVPLSLAAQVILKAQPRRATRAGKLRDLIFGLGEQAFSGWSNSKERLDATILEEQRKQDPNAKPLPHWTPHDLRRSAATHMANELDIEPHIIEAVLNHISGHKSGVAGIYNRAPYERHKRAALDRWAEYLLALVEGRDSNVTPLRREA